MSALHSYTKEEQIELRSNPFTHDVSDHRLVFTLAFKKFALEESRRPGMTSRKIFKKAGYRTEIFTGSRMTRVVSDIIKEAASPGGLKAPRVSKGPDTRKKHHETEIRELKNRVQILEQELDFLKKIRYLDMTGDLPPEDMS